MKNRKLLTLSLVACSLLTSCDKDTTIKDDKPVGTVTADGVDHDTVLTLQKFYDSQKTNSGGSTALKALMAKLFEFEYGYNKDTGSFKVSDSTSESFDVRKYHTEATFKADIQEKFQDIIDGHSYTDDDGNFDPEEYRYYIEETLDYDVLSGVASKYLDATITATLGGYNYDNYIEEALIPSILENYLYVDYVTGASKYKAQFANQYAVKLEVLKMPYDSGKLNATFSDGLVRDVKAIAAGNGATHQFAETDYSFVTFDSDFNLIVFETTSTGLTYNVYKVNDAIKALYDTMLTIDASGVIDQVTLAEAKAVAAGATLDTDKSWTIGNTSTTNEAFYKNIEQVLIARALWKIDYEVVQARNYDYRTVKYEALPETEKGQAQSASSTYSSSGSKSIKDVVKTNKISAQQVEYYSEPDYYNKSTYSNVLPSTLSSLRGYSAKELITNLRTFNGNAIASGADDQFLLPTDETYTDPVYLDVSSSTYYICEVSDWYGLYLNENILNTSSTNKTITNYQITAYQDGQYATYKWDATNKKYVDDATYKYADNPEMFESIKELVEVSVTNIISTSMRKEAMVALFEKYGLVVRDQDVYDYLKEQYPDFFEED